MTKLWIMLLSLLIVASVSAQDLTIVPNYINGIRINGDLLDDLDNIEGGGPAGEAGGDLEGNYPNPTIKEGVVGSFALENSTITPGMCGDATNSPQIDWDVDGRGLSCTEIPIEFPAPEAGSITEAMLEDTTVTPGTYGSTTQSVQIIVGAKGRITGISNQEISGIPTGSVGPSELESTAVVAGECGDATHFCVPDIDEDGRIISTTVHEVVAGSVPDAIEAESVKLTPVVETTSCNMAFANHQITPSGTTTCTLPAAATDTVGTYNFYVMNTNSVVIAKTGSDKINDVSASMAAVVGPLAHIQCTNTDDVDDWRCSVTKIAGYGSPLSTLCTATGGQTNNSSSSSGTDVAHTNAQCVLPAAKLTEGSFLKVCGMWELFSGSAPPTLLLKLKANGTTLAEMPEGGQALHVGANPRVMTQCYTTLVGAISSGSSRNFFTGPVSAMNGFGSNSFANSTVNQPVPIDVSGTVTLLGTSQFSNVGTGTTTVQLLAMTVEGSGLLP